MFLDHRFRKHTLKSVQLHSEAMRNRGHEAPLVRKLSQADSYPTQCQYIIGEPTKADIRRRGSEAFMCLDPTKENSSYCAHHHSRCYVKVMLTEGE